MNYRGLSPPPGRGLTMFNPRNEHPSKLQDIFSRLARSEIHVYRRDKQTANRSRLKALVSRNKSRLLTSPFVAETSLNLSKYNIQLGRFPMVRSISLQRTQSKTIRYSTKSSALDYDI